MSEKLLTQQLQQVAGYVDGDGTRISGTCFSVERIGEGRYLILFSTPFHTLYSACVTQVGDTEGNNSTLDNAFVYDMRVESIRIKTGDNNGNATNRAFSFIAFGASHSEDANHTTTNDSSDPADGNPIKKSEDPPTTV